MKFYRSQIPGPQIVLWSWDEGHEDLVGPAIGASNLDVHINTIDVGSGRGRVITADGECLYRLRGCA